ncbi:MAG: prepilin-type N-terminal cleavage/methylation domain-containing protein, partial [Synechococcus sp. SupBloom_Metag_053]|nr:prepilin-type N-terminal cleavage/methylation domain-containing protein [Synechococcus sp. SupBloom_Metag_053]
MAKSSGFSLLELLIASSLGLVVVVIVMNSLFGEGALGLRLSRGLREREALGRANALIKGDLERGKAVVADPRINTLPISCGLSGRTAVLHIVDQDGKLTTYSVGKPSEAIWRGWVLMRCGRAFRSDGSLNNVAAFQNRVV